MKKAVFVDRDGTLNKMVYDQTHGLMDSPRRPEQVELIPGAGRFLKEVRLQGYLAVVVSNQPGLTKGTLTLDELNAVHRQLAELLLGEGGAWDDLYYAAYHPEGGPGACRAYEAQKEFRKPAPGMLLDAAKKHDIDLAGSWMVGDGIVDVQAGRAAGCRTVLVTQLKLEQLEQFQKLEDATPDAVVADLAEAFTIIQRGEVPRH